MNLSPMLALTPSALYRFPKAAISQGDKVFGATSKYGSQLPFSILISI